MNPKDAFLKPSRVELTTTHAELQAISPLVPETFVEKFGTKDAAVYFEGTAGQKKVKGLDDAYALAMSARAITGWRGAWIEETQELAKLAKKSACGGAISSIFSALPSSRHL